MSRIKKTMDGNTAAAHVAYAFSEVAAIYPITPSSTMAELVDEWSAHGRKNVFGQKVDVVEMQSEAGAAGAVHGSLAAGALTSTYTASQGLLLMIPNMYKIAGERLPGVFHVAARALASHALSIYGDHQDVMAARQTGFALLASGSVQESMDLAAVAHLSAIKGRVPFVHFFDGFRTSHEIQKIEVWDYDELAEMVDYEAVKTFRDGSLNPSRPKTMGTAQGPDIYFQAAEASNQAYIDIVDITDEYMKEVSRRTGRNYGLFNYYGATDAENVIVAMGSVTQAAEEVVDRLVSKGEKVGLLKVRLYRPFSKKHFLETMPKTVKRIAVLDRTKEKGSLHEPMYLDVKSVYYTQEFQPLIVGGRYGLGSKDTTPTDINAVYDNLKAENPKDGFTISIKDDVTNTSLEIKEEIRIVEEGTTRCKFWGFGSDGTVGANKQAIKIIGDHTDMYAQGYFDYDSKKSGGLTISHLRFGKTPIRATYLLDEADFVSVSKQSYVYSYDLLKGLKRGGTFLLNTIWSEEELEEHLPGELKRAIANNDIKFYIINASKIAVEIGLGNRTNMVIQSAFFKLAKVLPIEESIQLLKDSVYKTYGKKGDKVLEMNYKAIDAGIDALVEVKVPESWKEAEVIEIDNSMLPDFIRNIMIPMARTEGNSLPVSTFVGIENGEFENGSAAYEKRGIALNVPEWQLENCIQCNQCSYVCPHAVIRPFLLNEKDKANAPEGFTSKKAIGKGLEDYDFRIQVSVLDCTGCGNCADVCPAKDKALIMKPFEEQVINQKENWKYAHEKVGYKTGLMPENTVKGSQFKQPLLEFSGACAGCGETPYAKLVTQLFGERTLIANATGCSSIWGGSAPATPYTCNKDGEGPSWGNSLFEDAAEYGFGMLLATKKTKERVEFLMKELLAMGLNTQLDAPMNAWLEGKEDYGKSKDATVEFFKVVENVQIEDENAKNIVRELIDLKDYMVKKSVWIFGGDGWSYDIGFGGLDHVLASGEDINVLVFDTEVYSNTGGQSSKATPLSAVAKFAASGKKIRKKDLGLMMSTYGYVYVAQVALGANQNQLIKTMVEAESYKGPSLIIAYAPCINHGLKTGMGKSVEREKLAVESGYWHLYRFDPRRAENGQNPFQLDSKPPTKSFQEFLQGEVRYTSLERSFPEIASELYAEAERASKERYANYVRMSKSWE